MMTMPPAPGSQGEVSGDAPQGDDDRDDHNVPKVQGCSTLLLCRQLTCSKAHVLYSLDQYRYCYQINDLHRSETLLHPHDYCSALVVLNQFSFCIPSFYLTCYSKLYHTCYITVDRGATCGQGRVGYSRV